MVKPQYVSINSFDTIVSEAKAACSARPVRNMLLAYEFAPDLVNSQFVKLHESKAREWQSDPPPANLFFSHGQYFLGEKGIQYVIQELKTKSSSRRALLSLGGMDAFIESGDRSIPSFMISQFAIEADTLYVTEYFRAIEVGSFLPINITEAALLVKRIIEAVRRPTLVRLLILAFHAHLTPAFHCLEKATVDMMQGGEIGVEVARRNSAKLIEWLEGKKVFESEIATQGLEQVVASVRACEKEYSQAFRSNLEQSLHVLLDIKKMRGTSSLESAIESRRSDFVKLIDAAIGELRRTSSGV